MSKDFSSFRFNFTCERIIEAISSETDLNIPNNLSWPCSICNKNVTAVMKGLQCDTCDKLCHIKCNSMSVEEYEYFQTLKDEESIRWNCAYGKFRCHYIAIQPYI